MLQAEGTLASENVFLSYIFTQKNGHNLIGRKLPHWKKFTLVLKTTYKKLVLRQCKVSFIVFGP